MSEMLSSVLGLAIGAGVLLGAIFFGGLWWTVRRGIVSDRPGVWFMGSMLLRTGIVATGFYFLLGLTADGGKILLAGLAGFLMARGVATRFLPAPFSGPLDNLDGAVRGGQMHGGQMHDKDGER